MAGRGIGIGIGKKNINATLNRYEDDEAKSSADFLEKENQKRLSQTLELNIQHVPNPSVLAFQGEHSSASIGSDVEPRATSVFLDHIGENLGDYYDEMYDDIDLRIAAAATLEESMDEQDRDLEESMQSDADKGLEESMLEGEENSANEFADAMDFEVDKAADGQANAEYEDNINSVLTNDGDVDDDKENEKTDEATTSASESGPLEIVNTQTKTRKSLVRINRVNKTPPCKESSAKIQKDKLRNTLSSYPHHMTIREKYKVTTKIMVPTTNTISAAPNQANALVPVTSLGNRPISSPQQNLPGTSTGVLSQSLVRSKFNDLTIGLPTNTKIDHALRQSVMEYSAKAIWFHRLREGTDVEALIKSFKSSLAQLVLIFENTRENKHIGRGVYVAHECMAPFKIKCYCSSGVNISFEKVIINF